MDSGIDWRFPVRITAGSESLLLHVVCETLGIFIAFRLYVRLRRSSGDAIPNANRMWILIAATLGAVAGSHLLGALEDLPRWRAAPDPWAYFRDNKTLVGGLLGGLWAVELAKVLIGERQRSGDLFVYPLIVGMIIGRVGCFSMGIFEETYGLPSSAPWALDLGDGILRHPVTAYEIIFLVLLGFLIRGAERRWRLDQGGAFKIFMISYLLFRFCLDFIKPGWRFAAGLGSIQLACVAGLVYYARYLISPSRLLQPPIQHDAR